MEYASLGQSFYGKDVVAIHLDPEGEARVNGLTIHDDGAGPAVTVAAPLLGSRQLQLIPQDFQQSLPRFCQYLNFIAIDLEGYGHFPHPLLHYCFLLELS
jgi:hypothetical protein